MDERIQVCPFVVVTWKTSGTYSDLKLLGQQSDILLKMVHNYIIRSKQGTSWTLESVK
jgi:hypothetical protein